MIDYDEKTLVKAIKEHNEIVQGTGIKPIICICFLAFDCSNCQYDNLITGCQFEKQTFKK